MVRNTKTVRSGCARAVLTAAVAAAVGGLVPATAARGQIVLNGTPTSFGGGMPTANALTQVHFKLTGGPSTASEIDPIGAVPAVANTLLNRLPTGTALRTGPITFGDDAAFAAAAGNSFDAPAPGLGANSLNTVGTANDNFTFLYKGQFTAPAGGATTYFRLDVDDNAAIFIDRDRSGTFETTTVAETNERVVNDANGGNPLFTTSPVIALVPGQSYNFAIAMYEGGGGSKLNASFSTDNTTFIPIEPGNANQANVFSTIGATNLPSTTVSVTASSTLTVVGPRVTFGALTMNADTTLTVESPGFFGQGSAGFAGTTASGTVGFATTTDVTPGIISAGAGGLTTINKTGAARLVLNDTSAPTPLTVGTTFNVSAGGLVAVRDGTNNPLGGATVNLNGGGLFLGSKGGNVTFANPVTVSANSTITGTHLVALAGGVVGTTAAPVVVTLGDATNGITNATAGTNLTLGGAAPGNELRINGVISGAGNLVMNAPGASGTIGAPNVAGPAVLGAVNSYTGSTTVTAGLLRVGVQNAINASSGITVNGGSAILDVRAAGGLNPAVPVTVTSGNLELSIAGALAGNETITFNGGGLALSASNALPAGRLASIPFRAGAATALTLNTAAALPGPVSLFNGSRLNVQNTTANNANIAAVNQTVNLFPGSVLELNAGLTGTGVINRAPGVVVRASTGTGLSGSQFAAANVGPRTVVQLSTNDVSNLNNLTPGAVIEVFNGDRRLPGGATGAMLSGVVLTNDGSGRSLTDNATALAVAAGGLTIAGTSGQTFTIAENITSGGNPLRFGTFLPANNLFKSGTVRLGNGTGNNFNLSTVDSVTLGGASTLIGAANTTTTGTPTNLGVFGGTTAANLLNLTVTNGTLRVDSASTTANSGLAVGAVRTGGNANLSVSRGNASFTNTLILNGPLTRVNNGVARLVTTSTTATTDTLGRAASDGGENFRFATAANEPARVGGTATGANMVAPWMSQQFTITYGLTGTTAPTSPSAPSAHFVDYAPGSATGFTRVAYDADTTSLAGSTATTIKQIIGTTVVNNEPVNVAALRVARVGPAAAPTGGGPGGPGTGSITGTGTINIGTGGLILTGEPGSPANQQPTEGVTIANTVNFGSAEGVIYGGGNIFHTLSGPVAGTNGITRFGGNTIALTANNANLSGDITANEGLFSISNDNQLGNPFNRVVLNGGGIRGTGPSAAPNVISTARSFVLNDGGGTLETGSAATVFEVSGVISGPGRLVKSATGGNGVNQGVLRLTAAGGNTYSGGTYISVGTVEVARDDLLGAASGFVVMNNAGSLFASLRATGTFTSAREFYVFGTAANQVPTFEVTGTNALTLSGPIRGSGGLVKSGPGTLILTNGNGNGYLGATSVAAGTLLVNNATLSGTGAGDVTVGGGTVVAGVTAVIGGTGTIAGSLTLAGTGIPATLAPGASPGTLDIVRNLTMAANSTYAVELAGTTPGDVAGSYDQTNVGEAATLAGTLAVSLLDGFAPSESDVFYILSRASGTGAFANAATEGAAVDLGNGVTGQITYLANWTGSQSTSTLTGGNDVALFNVVVPEPGTAGLIAAAAAGLLSRRRRRTA